MKKNVLIVINSLIMILMLSSCKDENLEFANNSVSDFERFIDSLSSLKTIDVDKNWDKISKNYYNHSTKSLNAIKKIDEKDKDEYLLRLEAAKIEFEKIRVNIDSKFFSNK